MKSPLIRNVKITLSLLALAALFQNCSTARPSDDNLSLKLRSHQVTGVKCPIYLKPDCIDGAQSRLVENERGCSYHICEKRSKLSLCPKQSTPLCKRHEEIVEIKDQNSCSFLKCSLKNTVHKKLALETTVLIRDNKTLDNFDKTCPTLNSELNCSKGMKRTLAVDSNSCLTLKCKKQKSFSCPIADNVACRKNETTFSIFDQKGCAQTVCKNTAIVNCPTRLKLSCKRDELVNVFLDEKGCKKSLCIKKPKVVKQGCNLKKPPRCFSGKRLRVAVQANGCSKPYCY